MVDTDRGVPAALLPLVQRAADFRIDTVLLARSATPDLPSSCRTISIIEPDWSAQIFLPSLATDPALIRTALEYGICTLMPEAAALDDAGWVDILHGWLENPAAGFFAKLYPGAIHVGNPARLQFGLGVTFNPRAIILNAGRGPDEGWVRIGRASHVGADCLLNLGPTSFTVGNFTMISANFSAHAMRHSMTHISSFNIGKGPFAFFGALNDHVEPISVGNDVWIGESVKALPGVHFADGCIIGAGSVVTRSTEAFGIYAGNPARLLRYRFDAEKRDMLQATAWWTYEYRRLVDIQDHFRMPVNDLNAAQLRELL
jgi:acetyltransferase-like isoleucine patch superfamily enzyme